MTHMQTIKIKCPAKINLSLKIFGKLPNGFHEIESIMQTINLFDYLTITVEDNLTNKIVLTGNSNEIPYDETNLVYKAVNLYLKTTKIENKKISIYIEKNIPIAAGLAGGSTDAAGVLYGLDKILLHSEEFNNKIHRGKIFCHSEQSVESENFAPMNDECYIDNLCSQLGSDLNVCLHGGRILAKGRGENITPLEFEPFNVSLIKPINLGISAKEAYIKFSQKIVHCHPEFYKENRRGTSRVSLYAQARSDRSISGAKNLDNKNLKSNIEILKQVQNDKLYKFTPKNKYYENDLEWAIIDDYQELQYIKQKYPQSVMTGSGSTYFVINDEFEQEKNYWVKNGLSAIDYGVKEI